MMMYKKGAHDMSYEIVVKKGGRIVRLEDDSEARTNVTFNYSDLLEQAFGDPNGIRILNRRKAENAVRLLKNAINNLSDDNPSPTVEEMKAEREKYLKHIEELRKDEKHRYYIFTAIYSSYVDNLELRIRTADPVTGRAIPSCWDSTPYNTKKALKRVLSIVEQCPPDARVGVYC